LIIRAEERPPCLGGPKGKKSFNIKPLKEFFAEISDLVMILHWTVSIGEFQAKRSKGTVGE
jgi:hypothetical protein